MAVDSTNRVPPLPTLPMLTRPELEALLVETYGKAATLEQTVGELHEEIFLTHKIPDRLPLLTAFVRRPD